MGFFGTYLFDARGCAEVEPDTTPDTAEPWLVVDIHDSDIATVSYRPCGRGTGIAYLGFTPRIYFEDDAASAATDTAREAAGLVSWWEGSQVGPVDTDERARKVAEIQGYLAEDVEDDLDDGDDIDDGDVFVEIKTARFLAALGLPAPEGLNGDQPGE